MKLLIPLFFACTHLLANPSSISSQEASYDGNTLTLTGNVTLDHALGKMRAQNAQLVKEEKEHPFSLIYLNGKVTIALNNEAEISCSRAEFDFQNQVGTLLPTRGEKVTFTQLVEKGGERVSLKLQSARANLIFSQSQNHEINISKMHADEAVEIEYADGYILKAGSAIYEVTDDGSFILAFPSEKDECCHFSYKNDAIQAQKVCFHPQESKIILYSPKGVLKTLFAPNEIAFSCSEMVWDRASNRLSLSKNIHIADHTLGEVYCDETVELAPPSGPHSLYNIQTTGKTTIHTYAPGKRQTLTCFGTMSFDQESLTSTFESPLVDSHVPEGQQIEYRAEDLQLLASSGLLEYGWIEGHLRPTKLMLRSNVRLSESQHCALGDLLTYSLFDHTMTLSAKEGEKVLYWDPKQSLAISAKEVRIQKDPFTNKESVKGVGNVQFVFSSAENDLMKKMFPFYQLAGEL